MLTVEVSDIELSRILLTPSCFRETIKAMAFKPKEIFSAICFLSSSLFHMSHGYRHAGKRNTHLHHALDADGKGVCVLLPNPVHAVMLLYWWIDPVALELMP